jgi:hypothetical protein
MEASETKGVTKTHTQSFEFLITQEDRLLWNIKRMDQYMAFKEMISKFPAFHYTNSFITMVTRVQYLTLTSTSRMQPTPWHCIYDALHILSPHSRFSPPCCLVPSGCPLQCRWKNTERFHIYPVHRQSTWQFGFFLSSGISMTELPMTMRDQYAKTQKVKPEIETPRRNVCSAVFMVDTQYLVIVSCPKCPFQ